MAVILLLVFTAQTFYAPAFTLWFYANRKALAKEHCINQNRPELKCDGKCFLNMKLQEAEQHQDEDAPLQVKQMLDGSPYTPSEITHQLAYPENGSPVFFTYAVSYDYLHARPIFHPPLAA